MDCSIGLPLTESSGEATYTVVRGNKSNFLLPYTSDAEVLMMQAC